MKAGLVDAGIAAIDGTKIAADASFFANRRHEELAAEILAETDAVDAAEDDQLGDRRGDELPHKWAGAGTGATGSVPRWTSSKGRRPAITNPAWPNGPEWKPRRANS